MASEIQEDMKPLPSPQKKLRDYCGEMMLRIPSRQAQGGPLTRTYLGFSFQLHSNFGSSNYTQNQGYPLNICTVSPFSSTL